MYHKTYDIVYIGIFSVLLILCSWISIPTIIPFTLQTFGIFLALLVLGGKRGTSAIGIYLLLGSIGIPVFSNFGAGLGYLFGNTGGFALGFLLIGLSACFFEYCFGSKPFIVILSLLVGLIACYAFGCLWFLFISTSANKITGTTSVLSMCILPFIIPDLCKLGLAFFISKRLKPLLKI